MCHREGGVSTGTFLWPGLPASGPPVPPGPALPGPPVLGSTCTDHPPPSERPPARCRLTGEYREEAFLSGGAGRSPPTPRRLEQRPAGCPEVWASQRRFRKLIVDEGCPLQPSLPHAHSSALPAEPAQTLSSLGVPGRTGSSRSWVRLLPRACLRSPRYSLSL